MKKGTQTRRHERPRQCGPRPHPAGGAEERPPAGLPTSGALSAAETAGAAAGSAGRGRPPPLPQAARPARGRKPGPAPARARRPAAGPARSTRSGRPGRRVAALTPLALALALSTGCSGEVGRTRGSQRDAGRGGGRGGRRLAGGGAGPGGGGSGSSHSRQIASRPLRASRRGRWRGRPGDLRVPAAGPASPRPRTRRGSGCAETPTGTGRGRGGSPCGAGGRGRGEEGAPDAPQRTTRSAPRAELRNTELAGSA